MNDEMVTLREFVRGEIFRALMEVGTVNVQGPDVIPDATGTEDEADIIIVRRDNGAEEMVTITVTPYNNLGVGAGTAHIHETSAVAREQGHED